jgi:hypothetical protein
MSLLGSKAFNTAGFNLHDLAEPLVAKSRNVAIGDDFAVEWKTDLAPDDGRRVDVEREHFEGRNGLRLSSSDGLGWVRMFVRGNAPPKTSLALVQIVLRVTTNASTRIEPMWVETVPVSHTRRQIEGSRERITLRSGVWTTIQGTRLFDNDALKGDLDFVMNLPQDAEVEIAAVDLSWVPVNDGFVAKQMPVENYASFAIVATRQGALPEFSEPLSVVASGLAQFFAAPHDLPDTIAHLFQTAQHDTDFVLLHLVGTAHCDLPQIRLSEAPSSSLANLHPATLFVDVALAIVGYDNGESPLGKLDILAIGGLGQLGNADGVLVLEEPRDLFVELNSPERPEDTAYWNDLTAQGLITAKGRPQDMPERGQVLTIASETRLSPIAMAMLRTAKSLAAGTDIVSIDTSTHSGVSWATRLGLSKHFFELGVISKLGSAKGHTSADATIKSLVICESSQEPVKPAAARVGLDQAYAFVVPRGPDLDLDGLVNIENCRQFESLHALKAELADTDGAYDHKPVVFVSSASLSDQNYLLTAVQAHWRYGAGYVLSEICCDYDAATGRVAGRVTNERDLSKLALTQSVCTMPAAEILKSDDAHLTQIGTGLFVPSAGFAVVLPSKMPVDKTSIQSAEASFDPDKQSPSVLEQLALAGPLDVDTLRRLAFRHWRLSSIIDKQVYAHKKLISDVRVFAQAPSPEAVTRILKYLTEHPENWSSPDTDIDGFLLSLAKSPEIYLDIPNTPILPFLEVLSVSAVADEAAAALALKANYTCGTGTNNIYPLFEFLALCLPSRELNIALMLAASRCRDQSSRYGFRIADCIRRYGSDAVLQIFFTMTIAGGNDIVNDQKFISSFSRLLQMEECAVFEGMIGNGFSRRLADQIDTITAFLTTVAAGDRDAALKLLDDEERLSKVDLRELCDSLRPFSNELQDLSLPLKRLLMPEISNQSVQKLAALMFRDKNVLNELRSTGAFDQVNDHNSLALSELGDNGMLNSIISKRFCRTSYSPLGLEGENIFDVFENAQSMLSDIEAGTKKGPLISVIISAFNPNIDLLRKAIGSISAQTHSEIEIFVIDDCSDPDSAAELAKVVSSERRATLIRLEQNSGPYIGRNIALEQAKGEFIAIQDADDWAHPQRFEAQIAAFDATPEAKLVTTEHIRVDWTGKIQMEAKFAIFGDGPMSSLFRRDVFYEVGPFAHVRSRGDIEMRERIRSFYGRQAIIELELPMMLCLANSQTLSQITKQRHQEHLQLFRSRISRRKSLARFRRDGQALADHIHVIVPSTLRATRPEKSS